MPDRLQEARVLDDDQAHFQKIALGKAEVQAQLNNYMDHRKRLEAHHGTVMAAHADGTWVTVSEAAALKRLAKDAMQQL